MKRKPLPPPPGSPLPAPTSPATSAPYCSRYRLRDVADLIYYDGPLLSLFEDVRACPPLRPEHSTPVLIAWCDTDDEANRWLVVRSTWPLVVAYLTRSATLLDVYRASIAAEDNSNPRAVFEDLNDDIRVVRSSLATLAEVAAAGYLPGEDSYHDGDFPVSRANPPRASAVRQPRAYAQWVAMGSKLPDPSAPDARSRYVILDVDAVENAVKREVSRHLAAQPVAPAPLFRLDRAASSRSRLVGTLTIPPGTPLPDAYEPPTSPRPHPPPAPPAPPAAPPEAEWPPWQNDDCAASLGNRPGVSGCYCNRSDLAHMATWPIGLSPSTTRAWVRIARATVGATPSTRTFFAPDLGVDDASLSDLAAANLIERSESLDDAWKLLDRGRALASNTLTRIANNANNANNAESNR